MTQQPSGSEAEKRQPAALHLATSCVSCFLVMLSITGCGAEASSTARVARTAGSAPNLKPVVVEAGVVLAGRDGYLCLPLEQVGVSPNASVVAIESSCECVQPRLVEYIAPSGTPEQNQDVRFRPTNCGFRVTNAIFQRTWSGNRDWVG